MSRVIFFDGRPDVKTQKPMTWRVIRKRTIVFVTMAINLRPINVSMTMDVREEAFGTISLRNVF